MRGCGALRGENSGSPLNHRGRACEPCPRVEAPRLAAPRGHTQAHAGAKVDPAFRPRPRGEQRPRGAMGCGASSAAALPLQLGPLEAWSEQARARAGGCWGADRDGALACAPAAASAPPPRPPDGRHGHAAPTRRPAGRCTERAGTCASASKPLLLSAGCRHLAGGAGRPAGCARRRAAAGVGCGGGALERRGASGDRARAQPTLRRLL
jgi:hypothetical protein